MGVDAESWPQQVLEYAARSPHDHFVLISNSVNPLTGQIHDFTWLQNLPVHKRFTVCVDDSHGIGWMGEHGEGIASSLIHLPQVEYILTYSLAKALHIPGGAISCPHVWAERLRNAPYYTGSTPMAPAFAHALLHAGPLYEVQRTALIHNLSLMKALSFTGEKLIPTDIPVFLINSELPSKADHIVQFLQDNGVIVSSFAYPDPQGTPINRLVISSLHKESDFQTVVNLLNLSTDL
jgi:7-keto-8-aminopelargonate synthetase-like enzyme